MYYYPPDKRWRPPSAPSPGVTYGAVDRMYTKDGPKRPIPPTPCRVAHRDLSQYGASFCAETARVDAPYLETVPRADVNTELVASLAAATQVIAEVGLQLALLTATQ